MSNPRLLASQIIAQLLKHEGSLSTLLPPALNQIADDKDKALLQELCYGTARWQPRLQRYLDTLLEKPLRKKDSDVYALLLIGLYQLCFMRVPNHAAVNESVAVAARLKKNWAKGLVNGVLRRFQREQSQLDQQLGDDAVFKRAHPKWLIDAVETSWPDHALDIFNANNQRPPMTLRVNQKHYSRQQYLQLLQQSDLQASATKYSDAGITLADAVDVSVLPEFDRGACSVQDEAAQLAAPLLELEPGLRVLDACCAPGGKTAHLLESQPQLESCVALDISADRNQRVAENLQRLQLQAELISTDACATDSWWDGKPFQRILIDAPCSGTGVIRRHPDIKLLRDPDNIAKLVTTQLALLRALWPLLSDDGILLYATCSILPAENSEVIAQFIATEASVSVSEIDADWGQSQQFGRQLLPQRNGHDGFYYAKLRKAKL